MKIKTSELEGVALDWAVATGLGYTRTMVHPIDGGVRKSRPAPWGLWDEVDGDSSRDGSFHPSSNWSQGGPIIESNLLVLCPDPEFNWGCRSYMDTLTYYGPTPLIAAMRCYVASQLGDEVEIPDALIR